MSGDLLGEATRALRETTAQPQPRSGLTRARLLESAEKRYTSRRFGLMRWVMALVVALAASTALARVAQYWPEIKRAIAPAVSEPGVAPKRKAGVKRVLQPMAAGTDAQLPATGAAAEVAVAPQASSPVVPSTELAPAVVPPTPAPRRAKPRVPRPKPARSPASPALKPSVEPEAVAVAPAPEPEVLAPAQVLAPKPAPESAELALFRRAQRLHLAQDARALAAWDDYLRVASRGVLAPEAKYNRALCLIRLGRKSEARSALTAFANGAYGSYRRSEAKALIEALDRSQK